MQLYTVEYCGCMFTSGFGFSFLVSGLWFSVPVLRFLFSISYLPFFILHSPFSISHFSKSNQHKT